MMKAYKSTVVPQFNRRHRTKVLRQQALNVCILASKNRENKHLLEMCIIRSYEAVKFEDEEQSY